MTKLDDRTPDKLRDYFKSLHLRFNHYTLYYCGSDRCDTNFVLDFAGVNLALMFRPKIRVSATHFRGELEKSE